MYLTYKEHVVDISKHVICQTSRNTVQKLSYKTLQSVNNDTYRMKNTYEKGNIGRIYMTAGQSANILLLSNEGQ